jgi:putative endonuclease
MNILKVLTSKRQIGDIGERAAIKFLRKRGYRIVKTGYVAASHEIDIIAENRDTRAFIEVKTRTEGKDVLPRPASAVNKEKMRAIISAARIYSSFNVTDKYQRFDVIEVILDDGGKIKQIDFLEDAFRADSHR